MKPTPTRARARRGELLRFIDDVAVNHASDECLIWPHSKDDWGYGKLHLDGKTQSAHRIVCERAHGKPPTPKHEAAHGCGNRACVNPKHLRWATSAENKADMLIHGTSNRGERCGSNKLTKSQVLEIRALHGLKPQSKIAKQFNVSPSLISAIHIGRKWSWL